ncbi:MAG: hypothetical protein ACT4O2_16200 [Beijerinckiaceae bacterium]
MVAALLLTSNQNPHVRFAAMRPIPCRKPFAGFGFAVKDWV